MSADRAVQNQPTHEHDVTGRGLPLHHGDVHTRAIVKLVRERVTSWNADPPGPSAVGVPSAREPLDKTDVLPGILAVPTLDEDGQKFPLGAKATVRVTRSLPLTDDADPWPSASHAARAIAELEPLLPTVDVVWTDPTSDRAIEQLAFQGLAAHRLVAVEDDPAGAAYAVDLSWMFGLPVRDGLEPYGACAYFSPATTLQRIYTSHDDRQHRPSDPTWADAKWRWRCALLTAVTVADHLGATHFLVSNLMLTATREQLPPDHALRRFLKPYEYRTADVNLDAAIALSPDGGLAHRTFAFTYAGLARCLLRGIETTTFQTFPQALAARGVDGLGERYPYGVDGSALYCILHAHVQEYVDIYLSGQALLHDPDVRSWWQALAGLAPSIGIGPLTRPAQVVDLLAQFLFTVTGFHSQVGNVIAYVSDPAFMGAKIRAGRQIADIQATVQLLNLAALTGLQQPPLLGDFTHLLLEREKPRAVAAIERFHHALRSLAATIEARNTHLDQPFQTFNPVFLESSVSV